jgi:hypothetical protein
MLGIGVFVASHAPGSGTILPQTKILGEFKDRIYQDGGIAESYSCAESSLLPLLLDPGTFTTGLLEFYYGAAAAYSLRQIRRSVSTYAIRVRRSSDDTELDIGFTSNGYLDLSALLAFAGDGDACVSKWYDQSSNGNDAVQSTPSEQPKIVSSGSLITENGKPALQFDGVNSHMDAADVTTTQPTTVSFVATGDTVNDYFFDGDDATDRQAAFSSSGIYSAFAGTTQSSGTAFVAGLQINIFALFNSTAGALYLNNTGGEPKDMGIRALTGLVIGQRYTDTGRLDGRFQELIFWNADHSDGRTTIQNNVNDFYSIYS